MNRVVIDARMWGVEHTGIGRYLANLLEAIREEREKGWEFSLLIRKKERERISSLLGRGFDFIPVEAPHYSLREQGEIPLILSRLKPDLVHFPHFNIPVFSFYPFVVTIHDLVKHFFRGRETTTRTPFLYWPRYGFYRFIVWWAVKRARLVIVPTRWWQKRLGEIYPGTKNKIFFIHEGVDPFFLKKEKGGREKANQIRKKYHLEGKRFIIYTGNLYPHKNVDRLVAAVSDLKEDLFLALAGREGVFHQRLKKKFPHCRKLIFLGFVPDRELKLLYQEAVCLVQPSLMEGFGLTGLEAMACGCPVVSSRASCLPEVYGSAAVYFDPFSENDIKEKIRIILKDSKLRAKMRKRGYQRVKKFSWRKAARETLAVYQAALARK